MKAGDVLMRIAQAELPQNVMPDLFRGARGEGRNGMIREQFSQSPELPVFRTKLVSPFRDAVRFVDSEERQRHSPEELDEVLAQQPFGRKIEQPVFAVGRAPHDVLLIGPADLAVERGGW